MKVKSDRHSKFSNLSNWKEELLKLENLLRRSLFTFIFNRSTNMNYFIKTSQCELSYHKHRHFFVDFSQQPVEKLHVELLSLAY